MLKLPVEHLIFSGGGHTVTINYAITHALFNNNICNYDSIKSLWGSSAGAMTCLFLGLKLDIENELKPHIICKQWNKLFHKNIYEYFYNIYLYNGIFNKDTMKTMLNPLFELKNLPIDTLTMKQFYEYNQYDIHIMTYDYATSKEVIIHHETYPDFLVLDAIYCSCSIPLVFQPYHWQDTILLDPLLSFKMSYPISYCKEHLKQKYGWDEIECQDRMIGVLNSNKDLCIKTKTKFTSCFEYLFCLLLNFLISSFIQEHTKHEICIGQMTSPIIMYKTALSSKKRRKYYNDGYKLGELFAKQFIVDNNNDNEQQI
jgi:hypothetical protein